MWGSAVPREGESNEVKPLYFSPISVCDLLSWIQMCVSDS